MMLTSNQDIQLRDWPKACSVSVLARTLFDAPVMKMQAEVMTAA